MVDKNLSALEQEFLALGGGNPNTSYQKAATRPPKKGATQSANKTFTGNFRESSTSTPGQFSQVTKHETTGSQERSSDVNSKMGGGLSNNNESIANGSNTTITYYGRRFRPSAESPMTSMAGTDAADEPAVEVMKGSGRRKPEN